MRMFRLLSYLSKGTWLRKRAEMKTVIEETGGKRSLKLYAYGASFVRKIIPLQKTRDICVGYRFL
jgi:hypothetical protein